MWIRANQLLLCESALGREGDLLILKELNLPRLKVIEQFNSFQGMLVMKATFFSQSRAKSHQGSSFQRCPKISMSFWQSEAQTSCLKHPNRSTCFSQLKRETMKTRVNSTNL